VHISKQPAFDHPFLKNHTILVPLYCRSTALHTHACIILSLNASPWLPFRCGLLTTQETCMVTPTLHAVPLPKHGIRTATSALRIPYQSEGPRKRIS
jgi:hypothetical protein